MIRNCLGLFCRWIFLLLRFFILLLFLLVGDFLTAPPRRIPPSSEIFGDDDFDVDVVVLVVLEVRWLFLSLRIARRNFLMSPLRSFLSMSTSCLLIELVLLRFLRNFILRLRKLAYSRSSSSTSSSPFVLFSLLPALFPVRLTWLFI